MSGHISGGEVPGVLISGCWNRGVLLYTEVSTFQGVGIEEFHCIQRCPHFVGIKRFHLFVPSTISTIHLSKVEGLSGPHKPLSLVSSYSIFFHSEAANRS